MYLSKRKNPFS